MVRAAAYREATHVDHTWYGGGISGGREATHILVEPDHTMRGTMVGGYGRRHIGTHTKRYYASSKR